MLEREFGLWALEMLALDLLVEVAASFPDPGDVLTSTCARLKGVALGAGPNTLLQELESAVQQLRAIADAETAGTRAL